MVIYQEGKVDPDGTWKMVKVPDGSLISAKVAFKENAMQVTCCYVRVEITPPNASAAFVFSGTMYTSQAQAELALDTLRAAIVTKRHSVSI